MVINAEISSRWWGLSSTTIKQKDNDGFICSQDNAYSVQKINKIKWK